MEKNQEILALLNAQVVENTLSLQAVEEVKKILEENKTLKKEIEAQNAMKDRLVKEASASTDTIAKHVDKISYLSKRNEELEAKERLHYELGIKFGYEEKRGNEMKEILGMALRNTVLSKSRLETGSIPLVVDGGSNGTGYVIPAQSVSNCITETEELK